jgi:hypothetical protein
MAKKDRTSDTIIKDAIEEFEDSEQASSFNRANYQKDTSFARGSKQWPEAVEKQRIQEARPVLTINKLPALIRSVVNESKQNKPAIEVAPVDNGADVNTAQIINGIIRSIERNSNAQVAYGTAVDQAVTGGFGFFRIDIDYAHQDSFDLQAQIKRIPNALSVHWDTSSSEFDASDWRYAFISDHLSKEEYTKLYPDASMIAWDSADIGGDTGNWLDDDQIRVAEYFKRVEKMRKLYRFSVPNPETGKSDVQTATENQMEMLATAFFESQGVDVPNTNESGLVEAFVQASGIQINAERDSTYFEVMRYIINSVEVLEEEKWPGMCIPICPVWGDESYQDGKRVFKSLISDAKDSQAMFNFWRSATTELVALAPKTPWVGPKGFIPKGHESKWASANTRSHAYLEYDPSSGGAPQRQAFASVPAGAMQEAMNSNEDMQAITGIYPSSIGARSNETSGKAILARERQGDVSNFHFIDNLSRAIQYAGKILVDIIPSVYSERETIRILGEDQAEEVVQLTQEAGGSLEEGMTGDKKLYNLSVGRYDVTVKTGPSFSTQREETRETLIELMRAVPGAAGVVGDALLEHMDFQGADRIAKRLKAMLPENIRSLEDEKISGSDNPEAAALQAQLDQGRQQMQQMQQQGQALTKELEQVKNDKSADAQLKQVEAQLKGKELELKELEMQIKLAEAQAAANKGPDTPEDKQAQWDYDMMVLNDKQKHEAIQKDADRQINEDKLRHEAIQKDADRQVDLAKAILAKSAHDGEVDLDGAMDQASMIVTKNMATGDAKARYDMMEEQKSMAMGELSEKLSQAIQASAGASAPKRVLRDANNMIVGLETVFEELN